MFLKSPYHPKRRGQKTDAQASLLDVLPTILDWFGLEYPDYHILKPSQPTVLSGHSLLPLLDEDREVTFNETFFASHVAHEVTMYYPMRTAVLGNRYKLIHNLITPGTAFPIDQDFYLSPTFLVTLTFRSLFAIRCIPLMNRTC